MRTFTNKEGKVVELSDKHLARAIEIKLELQALAPKGRCKWPKLVSMMYAEGFTEAESSEQYRIAIKAEQKKQGLLPSSEADDDKVEAEPDYKETIDILSDGSQKSDKLLELNKEQMKDPEYLLQAHGYDPKEWELVKAQNSMWNMYTKKSGKVVLYSSKVFVKPLVEEFTIKDLAESVVNVEPVQVKIKPSMTDGENMLLVPLFDLHFGINTYDDYMETQRRIHNRLAMKYAEVVFVVGSDLQHHDNFRSTTASGTIIENANMEKAWQDACYFYEPLIKEALEWDSKVKIIYSKGNHSESMEWAFVKYLGARFPQAEIDGTFEERKIHVYGDSVLGFTHGDKRKKQVHNIFQADFPIEWGQAKDRAIYTGHFHHEQVFDEYGTVVRTLPTGGKTDEWHKNNGFVGANKRFQIFDYDLHGLSEIQYV